MSVVVGSRPFAHCEWLRADRVLHAILSLERSPSDDTIRNFFLRFQQADIKAFWRPLRRWLLCRVKCPVAGLSLDLDSTVFCREGQREGARKGFNSRRKGCTSHHPLLAVPVEAQFVLHGWLRSGNTGPACVVIPFLQEALALLPEGIWLRTVWADGGFFDGAFLDFLEERRLPYVVVARLTSTLKRHCAGIKDWKMMDAHHAAGEFTVKLFGWSKERRFVAARERLRETQAAVGRRLIDVSGYTFRVWVTNRSQSALELWRDYNGRVCIEKRIEELKHDLAADGFCLQPFFATESAFLAVLCTSNQLSLFQHQTTPDAPYRQPGTLRVAGFLCGAVLGIMGRNVVVKLSAAWGGLRKHKPLVDATLNWLNCTSLKLIPPEDRLAIGGVMIWNFEPRLQKSSLHFGVRV